MTLNRGPPTRRESNHVDIEQGFINALDVSVIEPELPKTGLQKSVFRPKANEDELVEVCLDNSVIVAGNDMLDESEEMKLPVVKDFIVQDCEVESIPLLNQDVVNMLAASKKDDKIGEVERKIEKMQISSSNVSVNINEAERRQVSSSNACVNINEAEERKSLPEVELRQPTGINSTVRASETPSPSLIKLPPTLPAAAKTQTESKR